DDGACWAVAYWLDALRPGSSRDVEQATQGDRGCSQDDPEDHAPGHQIGERPGEDRADQGGDEPGWGEQAEHPWTGPFGDASRDEDVENDGVDPAPGALQEPSKDERHRIWCDRAQGQATKKQDSTGDERLARTRAVGPLAPDDHADQSRGDRGRAGEGITLGTVDRRHRRREREASREVVEQ